MSAIDRVSAFLDRFGPQPHSKWELLIARVLFACVIAATFPEAKHLFDTQPAPNGVAQFMDVTWFGEPGVHSVLRAFGYLALGLYVWGKFPAVALGYLAFFTVVAGTLANSQGKISHSYQIVALVVCAQFAVSLFRCLTASHAFYASQLVIAGAYVTAAMTKLNNSGLAWIWNSPYLVTDLVKADRQNYFAALDGERFAGPEGALRYVDLILAHPMWARVLFAPGLLFELLAFVALLGPRWSAGTGLALISLHLGIKEVMGLDFPYNIACLAIFFVNGPYWVENWRAPAWKI